MRFFLALLPLLMACGSDDTGVPDTHPGYCEIDRPSPWPVVVYQTDDGTWRPLTDWYLSEARDGLYVPCGLTVMAGP